MQQDFEETLREFNHAQPDGALDIAFNQQSAQIGPVPGHGGGKVGLGYAGYALLGAYILVEVVHPQSALGMRLLFCAFATRWVLVGLLGCIRGLRARPSQLSVSWDPNGANAQIEMDGLTSPASSARLLAHVEGRSLGVWVQLDGRKAKHLLSTQSDIQHEVVSYLADLSDVLGCRFGGIVETRRATLVPVVCVVVVAGAFGAMTADLLTQPKLGLLCIAVGGLGALWAHLRFVTALSEHTPQHQPARVHWKDPADGALRTTPVERHYLLGQPLLGLRDLPNAVVLGENRSGRTTRTVFGLGATAAWACGLAAGANALTGGHPSSLSAMIWLVTMGTVLVTGYLTLRVQPVGTDKRTVADDGAYRTDAAPTPLEVTDEPLRFLLRVPRLGSLAELWVQNSGQVSRVGELNIGMPGQHNPRSVISMLRLLDPRAALKGSVVRLDSRWLRSFGALPGAFAALILSLALGHSHSTQPLAAIGIGLIPSALILLLFVIPRALAAKRVRDEFKRWSPP